FQRALTGAPAVTYRWWIRMAKSSRMKTFHPNLLDLLHRRRRRRRRRPTPPQTVADRRGGGNPAGGGGKVKADRRQTQTTPTAVTEKGIVEVRVFRVAPLLESWLDCTTTPKAGREAKKTINGTSRHCRCNELLTLRTILDLGLMKLMALV